jgi:hypothetical protein
VRYGYESSAFIKAAAFHFHARVVVDWGALRLLPKACPTS